MRKNCIKFICITGMSIMCTSISFAEETNMINVLKDIPYQQEMMGKRKVVDEDHLLIMQIALKPQQQVPQHNANSHVRLLVLAGTELTVTLDEVVATHTKGDCVSVTHKTPMTIKNTGPDDATFLVIKTPNPSQMKND